jgi:predicted metal-dependent peptidase
MSRKGNSKASSSQVLAEVNRTLGWRALHHHPIFGPLAYHAFERSSNLCPQDGWAVVTSRGEIHVNEHKIGEPEEWSYVFAHCLLHLGFGHFQQKKYQREVWNAACDCYIARFLADLKFGRPPQELGGLVQDVQALELGIRSEQRLFEEFCERGIPEQLFPTGTAGLTAIDMIEDTTPKERWHYDVDWQGCFARGLEMAVADTVDIAGGIRPPPRDPDGRVMSATQQARNWFITSYPLLGALAASFEIIEDQLLCHRMNIAVAAVNMEQREIYINPRAGLTPEELRFVMAHELLHVGLRHDVRCEGRDFYLWNVACDYVINGWLVEMGVGHLPQIGALYDPALKDESAEAIYDRIVRDLRHYRKSATLRGVALGDMLGEPGWWNTGDGQTLDEFYRNCLSQGLLLHQEQERGYLSAGLIEEIRALGQPPVPWDVELAHWFDEHFPPLEKLRTYARLSRRQSSTPDIPRPQWIAPPEDSHRTFGVLLDTSGSMDRTLLAKALGAIASYSIARDVKAVRVVFCDAATFDQGYMAPEEIADSVKVRGRGGTILQPGIDLLEEADDFPEKGPLLVITDGFCDHLHIKREHAFLLPASRTLPFPPKGPVFRIH